MSLGCARVLELAQRFLDSQKLERYGYTPMVDDKALREIDGNFVVAWNAADYLRTRNRMYSLAGNIPLFVDGHTGECRYATEEESRRYFAR